MLVEQFEQVLPPGSRFAPLASMGYMGCCSVLWGAPDREFVSARNRQGQGSLAGALPGDLPQG